MYLKKYDFNRVSLDVINKIWDIIHGRVLKIDTLLQNEHGISAYRETKKTKAVLSINDDTIYSSYNCSSYSTDNQPEIWEMILNTQWVDPKVELPEEKDKVIIKFVNGDIRNGVFYFANKIYPESEFAFCIGSYPQTLIDIIGWLPADNVVL